MSKGCQFDHLVEDANSLMVSGLPSIVLGDFNFDSDNQNCFVDFMRAKDLVQIVNQPTHKDGGLIDHCYVPKEFQERIKLQLEYPHYSDHASVCLNLH